MARFRCHSFPLHLREAIAMANKFVLRRLLTYVMSLFISPNRAVNIFAMLSVYAYICIDNVVCLYYILQ